MSKRKHISLPLKVKLDALSRIDKGDSLKTIALELGVSAVTVGDWKRNRLQLESWNTEKNLTEEAATSRSRMKKSEYEKTSQALFNWFSAQRQRGIFISGPILREKAQYFRCQLQEGEPDFTASRGWIEKWKNRYGVRQMHVRGEKLSADASSAEIFIQKFRSFIEQEGYMSCDQLTKELAYSSGSNFKMFPDKKECSASNVVNNSKVLPSSKASQTHKRRKRMIDKSKQSAGIAFKNLNLKRLHPEELNLDEKTVEMINNQDGAVEKYGDEGINYKISHTEGFNRLEKALEYVKQQDDVTPADVLFFKNWTMRAVLKQGPSRKQKKIVDYFKKQ